MTTPADSRPSASTADGDATRSARAGARAPRRVPPQAWRRSVARLRHATSLDRPESARTKALVRYRWWSDYRAARTVDVRSTRTLRARAEFAANPSGRGVPLSVGPPKPAPHAARAILL